jgi:hypothetical protein
MHAEYASPGVAEERLPSGSEIRFRDPTAWEKYRWQIILIAAALLFQTTLIIGLFYEHRRRRNAEATSRGAMGKLAHMSEFGPVPAPAPSAVAAAFRGAPVAGGMRLNCRRSPNLVRVRNRSKFRHHGPEARRLKVTHCGHGPNGWPHCGAVTFQ